MEVLGGGSTSDLTAQGEVRPQEQPSEGEAEVEPFSAAGTRWAAAADVEFVISSPSLAPRQGGEAALADARTMCRPGLLSPEH